MRYKVSKISSIFLIINLLFKKLYTEQNKYFKITFSKTVPNKLVVFWENYTEYQSVDGPYKRELREDGFFLFAEFIHQGLLLHSFY